MTYTKGTRFYVASGIENLPAAQQLIRQLEERGWVCTYDWTQHGSLQSQPDRWSTVAAREAYGVSQCDVFIALLPGARGTHFEFGVAYASYNNEIFLVGSEAFDAVEGRTCLFYHLPGVLKVGNVDELMSSLFGDAAR